MNFSRQTLVSMGAILFMSSVMIVTSEASQLSQAQQQEKQLQNEVSQNKDSISQQKQKAATAQNKVGQAHASVTSLNQQIDANMAQIQQIQAKIDSLNSQIDKTQTELQKDQANLQKMLCADYENGQVPYFAVLFKATSFSDLLSRIQTFSLVTTSEKELLNQTLSLQHNLNAERKSQRQNYAQVVQKNRQMDSLKQEKLNEEAQAQQSVQVANHQIDTLTQQQKALAKKLNMTQGEIQQLEAQAKQQREIIANHTGSSTVAVPSLRYRDISPEKLYNFVHSQGSAFSLSDIQTICSVAQSYNVNPALLVAITGQELDFVQNGVKYESWELANPFDVFGRYKLYHTTLAQSAAYAAEIVQVKLSVAPPAGEDAIIWINDPNNHAGIGVYATDSDWAYGVRTFYNEIESFVR